MLRLNEAYSICTDSDYWDNGLWIAIQIAIKNANVKPMILIILMPMEMATLLYDISETRQLKKVFGELAYNIPISSIKPITGQSFFS